MVRKIPLSTVATFSKVLCVNYHRFPSQSLQVVMIIPKGFSYAILRNQFTLLFGKSANHPKCVEAHKTHVFIFTSTINRLDFSYSNNYNKSTNLMCCLIISPLVVRRTFYLIVNDRNAESLVLLFLKLI